MTKTNLKQKNCRYVIKKANNSNKNINVEDNDIEMKDAIEGNNITSKIYGNENENKMNICNENEYSFSLGKNNSFNYKKCTASNNHLDDTLSTDCSIIEQNKQNFYFGKKQYNDINSNNCNKLNEECISEDKLKLNINNVKK